MMVVHDLWYPFNKKLTPHILSLLHIHDEKVAVIIVANILLVKSWQVIHRTFFRFWISHVPVRHQLLPIRIGMNKKDYYFIQYAKCFSICTGNNRIKGLYQLMCSHYLCRMESTI